MKGPVTFPAKTNTIAKVKAFFFVVVPRIQMMSSNPSAPNTASSAHVVSEFQYTGTPFPILRPIALSLLVSGALPLIIPVIFAPFYVRNLVFALLGTSTFPAIWFIVYLLAAYLTSKGDSSVAIIMRDFSSVRLRVFLLSLIGANQSNIPCSRLSFSKMSWPHARNSILFHDVTDFTPGITKAFSYFLWANPLLNIQIFKKFLCWFHNPYDTTKTVVNQDICTATNTWVRAALATW